MSNKTVVTVDVTDWKEEALREEIVPQTSEELVSLAVKEGMSAKTAARYAIAVRAAGLAPDDVLPGNKVLLGNGGGHAVHLMIASAKEKIKVGDKEYLARKYKAIQKVDKAVSSEGNGEILDLEIDSILPDHGYTEIGTPESIENAIQYLRNQVPGHIWNRLIEIKAADGDVEKAVEELVDKVREMAGKLE